MLKKVIIVVVMVSLLIVSFGIAFAINEARAANGSRAWIVCQPGDYVNVRNAPSTRSECVGMLDGGDEIYITGKGKNGFAEIEATMEVNLAWVHTGYIVFSKPEYLGGEPHIIESNGRVAARKYCNGPRRCWLVDGSVVKVYWRSEEWSVTDKGFVMTKYIGREGTI